MVPTTEDTHFITEPTPESTPPTPPDEEEETPPTQSDAVEGVVTGIALA